MDGQSKCEINLVKKICDRILRSDRTTIMKYDFSSLAKLHNSPHYRGVQLLNVLPASVQQCNTKDELQKWKRKIIGKRTNYKR